MLCWTSNSQLSAELLCLTCSLVAELRYRASCKLPQTVRDVTGSRIVWLSLVLEQTILSPRQMLVPVLLVVFILVLIFGTIVLRDVAFNSHSRASG